MSGYPGITDHKIVLYHYLWHLSTCKLLLDLLGVTLAEKGLKAERWVVSAPGGKIKPCY